MCVCVCWNTFSGRSVLVLQVNYQIFVSYEFYLFTSVVCVCVPVCVPVCACACVYVLVSKCVCWCKTVSSGLVPKAPHCH